MRPIRAKRAQKKSVAVPAEIASALAETVAAAPFAFANGNRLCLEARFDERGLALEPLEKRRAEGRAHNALGAHFHIVAVGHFNFYLVGNVVALGVFVHAVR